jgi:membrane-associated phospholipid phosphatase
VLNLIISAALIVSLLLTSLTRNAFAGPPASIQTTVSPSHTSTLTDPKFWLAAAFIAGGTIALYNNDGKIKDFMQENRNGFTDEVADVGNGLGTGAYSLPPLGIMYVYGNLAGDHRAMETAVLGIESFVLSGLVTTGIKYTTHRLRPNNASAFENFNGFSVSGHDVSFPSGHATSAFAIATVVATEYSDSVFIPVMAYSLAALTPLSRLNDNVHWASDVFLGSAIGFCTAKIVFSLHKKKEQRVQVTPALLYGRNVGLSVTYKF